MLHPTDVNASGFSQTQPDRVVTIEASVIGSGTYLNLATSLGPDAAPSSMQGLLGEDSGPAGDLALPDGSVLAAPVSDTELAGAFADAWRVTPGTSLLDGSSPRHSARPRR